MEEHKNPYNSVITKLEKRKILGQDIKAIN
jgi:hypothetical protein